MGFGKSIKKAARKFARSSVGKAHGALDRRVFGKYGLHRSLEKGSPFRGLANLYGRVFPSSSASVGGASSAASFSRPTLSQMTGGV